MKSKLVNEMTDKLITHARELASFFGEKYDPSVKGVTNLRKVLSPVSEGRIKYLDLLNGSQYADEVGIVSPTATNSLLGYAPGTYAPRYDKIAIPPRLIETRPTAVVHEMRHKEQFDNYMPKIGRTGMIDIDANPDDYLSPAMKFPVGRKNDLFHKGFVFVNPETGKVKPLGSSEKWGELYRGYANTAEVDAMLHEMTNSRITGVPMDYYRTRKYASGMNSDVFNFYKGTLGVGGLLGVGTRLLANKDGGWTEQNG